MDHPSRGSSSRHRHSYSHHPDPISTASGRGRSQAAPHPLLPDHLDDLKLRVFLFCDTTHQNLPRVRSRALDCSRRSRQEGGNTHPCAAAHNGKDGVQPRLGVGVELHRPEVLYAYRQDDGRLSACLVFCSFARGRGRGFRPTLIRGLRCSEGGPLGKVPWVVQRWGRGEAYGELMRLFETGDLPLTLGIVSGGHAS